MEEELEDPFFTPWTELMTFKTFLETRPLYTKLNIKLPEGVHKMIPNTLVIYCPTCKATRTFLDFETTKQPAVERDATIHRERERIRRIRAQGSPGSSGYGSDSLPQPFSGVFTIDFKCTECDQRFQCWVEISRKSGWVRKVGQLPMWLPQIPADILKELGEDADLYQKALRNMAEGYGIGACAYFRRLVEKYINPLLQLLLEIKKESGATEEELQKIESTIKGKEFAAKTQFAADIAPDSIKVQGMNPLRKLHDLLSVSLHLLEEEKAMEVAEAISNILQFVIRQLRTHYEERKAYIESMKKLNNLPL